MKNKNVKGIIALVLVTALSFGVIAGSKALTKDNSGSADESGAKVLEELDTKGAKNIEKAVRTEDGYEVTVRTAGYVGDILLKVFFDKDAATITKVVVLEQEETENVGAKIAEAEFLDQFKGVLAPVLLPGMTFEMDKEDDKEDNKEEAAFVDGTYTAGTTEFDKNGFKDELTMVVEGGKITSVVWDCVNKDGEKKSVLAEEGKYVMDPEGKKPNWKEQAEALAATVVENQNIESVGMKEDGKTDSVSGVSIYIGTFVSLVEDCMKQAAPKKAPVLYDGTYTAGTTEFDKNGFKDELTLVVKDGKITSVVWDCVNKDGEKKSVLSEEGKYVMDPEGKKPNWKEQAEALAATVVANQNVESVGMKEDGKTDSVTGVSIYIGGFVSLVEDCLAQASKPALALKDGTYTAGTEEFDKNGFKDELTLVVKDGKITSVVWDCVNKDGEKKSVLAEEGKYVMDPEGKKPNWKEQAEALAATVVANQNVESVGMKDDGKTDSVSGVSIYIGGFVSLVEKCLAEASVEAPAEPEAPANGTQVDAISGATVSSKAAVNAINAAYKFLQSVK